MPRRVKYITISRHNFFLFLNRKVNIVVSGDPLIKDIQLNYARDSFDILYESRIYDEVPDNIEAPKTGYRIVSNHNELLESYRSPEEDDYHLGPTKLRMEH